MCLVVYGLGIGVEFKVHEVERFELETARLKRGCTCIRRSVAMTWDHRQFCML